MSNQRFETQPTEVFTVGRVSAGAVLVQRQGVSRWAVAQFINRQRRASQPDAESATPSHSQQEHGALGSRGAAPAVRAAGRAPHEHGPAAAHLRRAGVAAGFESDGLVQEAPIVPQPACGCESMRKPGRLYVYVHAICIYACHMRAGAYTYIIEIDVN